MDDLFVNLGEEVILTLLWQTGASESVTASMFCYKYYYLLLTVRMWSFARHVRVHASVCVRGRHGHTTAACVLQTHTSIITVSVTRLCSPLGLELMVKLRTLLTVFTFILKAKARDYGKGRYISDSCLWCSANHNALCQLANQSRLRLSEGGTS